MAQQLWPDSQSKADIKAIEKLGEGILQYLQDQKASREHAFIAFIAIIRREFQSIPEAWRKQAIEALVTLLREP